MHPYGFRNAVTFTYNWRSTGTTKNPMDPRVIAIDAKGFFSPNDPEIGGWYWGHCIKRRTTGLSTTRAVANDDRTKLARNFVINRSAKTTTFIHILLRRDKKTIEKLHSFSHRAVGQNKYQGIIGGYQWTSPCGTNRKFAYFPQSCRWLIIGR